MRRDSFTAVDSWWTRPNVLVDRCGRPIAVLACLLTLADIVVGFVYTPLLVSRAVEAVPLAVLSFAASLTLFFGPGLALIHLGIIKHRWGLGLAIVPGILIFAVAGLVAWILATRHVSAHLVSALFATPVTVGLLVVALLPGRRGRVDRFDKVAMILVALLLVFGVARGLYSLGPQGDLYGGMISQALEASNRSDSRTSYYIVEFVANGGNPYGKVATVLYAPYTFSSRGPITGLASAPIVLLSGAVVPLDLPDQPWQPFDQQGFAAYRIAMEVFGALAMLTVYSLSRMLIGARTALFALVVTVGTPFVAHEVYFTWPKLLTAAFVLLAAQAIFLRKPIAAGVLTGLGFLVHPGALTSLPGLLLLWIYVVHRGSRTRKSTWMEKGLRDVAGVVALMIGVVVFFYMWQKVNGGHAAQSSEFLPYITGANNVFPAPSFGAWIGSRVDSLLDTIVPLFVFFTHARDPAVNPLFQEGRTIVRLFVDYWTSLPFAVGISFALLYAYGLYRALLLNWRLFVAVIAVPFVAFLIYWGSFDTGLMREGLHAWLLATIIAYAWARARSQWWPVRLERVMLIVRIIESLLLAVLPSIWTTGAIVTPQFHLTDILSLLLMLGSSAALGLATWWLAPRTRSLTPQPGLAQVRAA